jgi:hypothetical protein
MAQRLLPAGAVDEVESIGWIDEGSDRRDCMPEKKVQERARRDKEEGKSSSTQAGEFVREEIEHVREGKHGARSAKQAIAIGLSKARRAGVDLPPPKPGVTSPKTRRAAEKDLERGKGRGRATGSRPSTRRSRASLGALKREGKAAGSGRALSRQTKSAAARRSPADRAAASRKAVGTKGPARRKASAKKAARTRAAHSR